MTRPDIAYAVHQATRMTHQPRLSDWKLSKQILRYLIGTKDLKLTMKPHGDPRRSLKIESFSDADFAGDKKDRKSTSGNILVLNGMIIGWNCKKQGVVALSTMEAEYVSASLMAQEVLGLRQTIQELGLKVEEPITMWIDNQAAISQISSEASSAKSKHIDTKLKFIKDYALKEVDEG